MRYDIYHQEHRDDDGNLTGLTWHLMDTANRCADMGYTFTSREEALATCKRMDSRSRA
jgi:hypothetical protein